MSLNYPTPTFTKNDRKANIIIWSVSLIVFIAVVVLHEIKLDIKLGFDPHIFAEINAKLKAKFIINTKMISLVLKIVPFIV